jgi:hypothetical protein
MVFALHFDNGQVSKESLLNSQKDINKMLRKAKDQGYRTYLFLVQEDTELSYTVATREVR